MRLYRVIIICSLCGLLGWSAVSAQSNLQVAGLGYFQNRSLKSRLAFLHGVDPRAEVVLDAALLEDSAFLLLEQLKREGYLKPELEATFMTEGGEVVVHWGSDYAVQLDANFVAQAAAFRVIAGVFYFYKSVRVGGVDQLEAKALKRFFVPGGALIQRKRTQAFTAENFERRVGRLLGVLDGMGYREARVVSQSIEKDSVNGGVSVELEVDSGPRYLVGNIELQITREGRRETKRVEAESTEPTVLTRDWEQAQRARYRNEAFAAGYPDPRILMEIHDVEGVGDGSSEHRKDVTIHVDWGTAVWLSGVHFEGDPGTKRSVLKRKIGLSEGDRLDRLKVSAGRRQLMGLGIYRNVDVAFRPAEGPERELVYTLEPGVRKELKLLGGWGSYEQARAGFKWEHRNPFGRAHRYEAAVKQSLKASRVAVAYSMPQVFGTPISLYSNAEYSYREELSHERTKQGVSFGSSITPISGLRLSAEYGFFQERADRDDALSFESEEEATVASISLGISYDQRNDFLAPSSGYRAFAVFKIANQLLGGSVDFQKMEWGGTYHLPMTGSTLIHLGLKSGVIFTEGAAATNIPFNERFFVGGENTVRGYREGGASPMDGDGDEVGAESYVLANIEMEQRVYANFSTILFWDTVLHARGGFFDAEREMLYTLGLGLRYKTVVGPVRFEYGKNLNPRVGDPAGTFHFSIGFPF